MNPSPLGFNTCDVLCHRGRAVAWRPLQGWRRPWTPPAQHLPFTPVAAVFREAQNDPERRQDWNPSFPTSPCGPWLWPLPRVTSRYLSLPSVALHQPVPRPEVCSSAPPPCPALFHRILPCCATRGSGCSYSPTCRVWKLRLVRLTRPRSMGPGLRSVCCLSTGLALASPPVYTGRQLSFPTVYTHHLP